MFTYFSLNIFVIRSRHLQPMVAYFLPKTFLCILYRVLGCQDDDAFKFQTSRKENNFAIELKNSIGDSARKKCEHL